MPAENCSDNDMGCVVDTGRGQEFDSPLRWSILGVDWLLSFATADDNA